MKTFKFLFVFLMAILVLASCSKTEDEQTLDEMEEGIDMAAEVEGTYFGTIVSNDLMIIDTYEVKVKRLSNDKIIISGDQIPNLETTLTPQENPNGKYYSSPWQRVDDYVVAYWLASRELVFNVAEGEINFIGDKQ
ncbi:MAG: hypothetical protein AAF849_12270 [Bacteroidota bacterium]